MATLVSKLKGTLKIGTTPGVQLEPQVAEIGTPQTVTRDSPQTVLTGDVVQSQATYSWELSGTLLLDLTAPAATGIYYQLQAMQGTEQAFTYLPVGTPGPTFAGVCIIDGFDTPVQKAGSLISSSFKWPVQGKVTITPPGGTAADAIEV
jgi:hypothetical protein